MGRIPIVVQKISLLGNSSRRSRSLEATSMFQLSLEERGRNWTPTFTCNIKDLIEFRDQITALIETVTTADQLGVTLDQGLKLDEMHSSDPLCQTCPLIRSQNCIRCAFELQSPLERQLYVGLKKAHISFQTQYGVGWNGKNIYVKGREYGHPTNNFKEVLTIADFFIEHRGKKLCVYTDGHTYHERTEEQAQRDKRIDRKLQEHGYQVLRYTGKDVREGLDSIIAEIQAWLN